MSLRTQILLKKCPIPNFMPVLPITQKHINMSQPGFKSQKNKCEIFLFALDISYVQFLDFGLVQEIYLFKLMIL